MIHAATNVTTETDNRQEVTATKQLTYQERLDAHIAAQHVIEAKQRGIPLWILRDPGPRIDVEDDDIDWQ